MARFGIICEAWMKQSNELANYLDQVLPPHSTITPVINTDPLVDAALELALGPHPVLDDERMNQIQARILAPYIARRRFQARRRISLAATLILIFGLMTTMAASMRSLPDSPLYPMKRLVEQGQLAVVDDNHEIDLRLKLADRRLDEFETLLDRGDVRVETLEDATGDLNRALDLVEHGSGSAADVVTLSERQSQLTLDARAHVAPNSVQQQSLDLLASAVAQVNYMARSLFDSSPVMATFSADETILYVMPMDSQ
jgi:hypothetical protein